MAQEQTAYVGDDIKVLVNVIGSTGAHVVAVIDTTTTRLNGLAAAPTITTIATGVYQIVFSGVTPTPAESDRYTCKVNGTIAGVAWTEYGIPIKIVADERGTDSVVVPTSDITAIKSKTDQLAFTVANEVDSNSLTGGTSPAAIYTEFTSGSNADAFKATGFNTVAPDNASITLILADTNELQTNQGNWLTATGFATVNPDNASITLILADTNELQTNQGNWLTATGFNTVAPDNAGIASNGVAIATVDGVADSVLVIANKLDSAVELDGSDYRFTTNALEQGPTGSGSGIYTLTVTVEDSSGDAVPNSRVNISGTTTTLVTDSIGQATFNVDADTYTLVTSPPSEYNTPDNVAVTVSANTSQTITLTAASSSASAGWIG